jgi:hypothetical protein
MGDAGAGRDPPARRSQAGALHLQGQRGAGELALDEEDALQILAELSIADLTGRLESAKTPEWLYIFKPEVGGSLLYVKLIVRAECLVVSFHEDEGDADD